MADWKKTKCGTCVYQRKKPICNSCLRFQLYRPMTNAERIRAMDDEELAEFLARKSPCTHFCNYIGKTCQGVSCKQGILEWLQSEAE